ncbi:MAG: hypothetical protein JWN54_1390 [Mycobacterium sp.]|jgi:hypothetical protein|nr:hypothetical protein [Mycobacterium sp.]
MMGTSRTGRVALRVVIAAAFGLALFGSAAPASAATLSAQQAYSGGEMSGEAQTLGLVWL